MSLKPCPFCGKPPDRRGIRVECLNHHCLAKASAPSDEVWNERAGERALEAERDAARVGRDAMVVARDNLLACYDSVQASAAPLKARLEAAEAYIALCWPMNDRDAADAARAKWEALCRP